MSELPSLSTADFASWFEGLWGFTPFPWQEELVERVHTERRWPGLVDLPTGAGKTSLIDIALFLQALDAEQEPAKRWMPRRIVTVVDRRIVVDQAADRAREIAEALATDQDAASSAVATRLRRLAGTDSGQTEDLDPPLLVATLRGAIARDESWMRRPDVPAVLSSTVDQAGSRLLFRGYGISPRMRPIHAGLLGNDVLWLLDEVHLSRPFAQTLQAIRDLRTWRTGDTALPDRWGVVEMSATPSSTAVASTTGVGQESRIDDGPAFPGQSLDASSHPVLGRRLRASKPAVLAEVKVPAQRTKADATFAQACCDHGRRLVADGVRTVGVIVNRVDTARHVRSLLADAGLQVELLTGRMRPVDRDRKIRDLRDRLKTGRSRSTMETPLVLVATQCIEAGADFDLDAIVTEVASIDALEQRFGRVDRDGQLAEAGQQATSVILVRSTDLKGDPDLVYGSALRNTWTWLASLETIDFGIDHRPKPSEPSHLIADQGCAPLLLPTHLDQLCQTSNSISADPDISRWLHGDAQPAPDVHLVWRADIDEEFIREEHSRITEADGTSAALSERLGACPPAATETLTVSLSAVRRWLAQASVPALSDVEGIAVDDVQDRVRGSRPWVIWASGRATTHLGDDEPNSRHLRPGDVIVVPSTYGGLTGGSWDPASEEPVEDVAAEALHGQGRRNVLRLVPPLAPPLRDDAEVDLPTEADMESLSPRDRGRLIKALIEAIDIGDLDAITASIVEALRTSPARAVHAAWPPGVRWGPSDRERSSAILSCPVLPLKETSILTGPSSDTDADDDGSSFTGARNSDLRSHLDGVGDWSGMLARHLGLDTKVAEDLETAGRSHDEGKRDPRFQLLLHGGDEVAQAALGYHLVPQPDAAVLAKSPRREPSAKRRRDIREIAGYPLGARHELTSLALMSDQAIVSNDDDMVAHLVASHHGWCRPFAPPLIDTSGILIPTGRPDGSTVLADHGLHALDAGPPDRFWQLNRRYGWYGLAWLEAILRLADHRRSELEQQTADGPTGRVGGRHG